MDGSDYSVVNGVTVWQRPPRSGGEGKGAMNRASTISTSRFHDKL